MNIGSNSLFGEFDPRKKNSYCTIVIKVSMPTYNLSNSFFFLFNWLYWLYSIKYGTYTQESTFLHRKVVYMNVGGASPRAYGLPHIRCLGYPYGNVNRKAQIWRKAKYSVKAIYETSALLN